MGRFTNGEVAVVTAAAGAGIGQAVARKLGDEGAELVISDAHERRALEVGERLSAELGRPVMAMRVDVTVQSEVEAQVRAAIDRFGRIDIMCNNAGFNMLAPAWEMEADLWRRVIDINLSGAFYGIRAALPYMIERHRGVIVNMSSMNGYRSIGDGQCHYAAAKAGIMGLTRAVAAEVGQHGVRVVALAPGWIYNPFLSRMYGSEQEFKAVIDEVIAQTPLGRAGEPADIANLIAFLASEEASFITGEVVSITGGMYMAP